jgi:hypothetical protein
MATAIQRHVCQLRLPQQDAANRELDHLAAIGFRQKDAPADAHAAARQNMHRHAAPPLCRTSARTACTMCS